MQEESVLISPEDISLIFKNAEQEIENLDIRTEFLTLETKGEIGQIEKKKILKAQMEDAVISPVYHAFLQGKRPEKDLCKTWTRKSKILSLENGILIRNTREYKQLELPQEFHELVCRELHINLAHMGSERVIELARKRFYWPKLKDDVEFFIKKKCRCVIAKKPNRPDRAPLTPIESTYPFEMISDDFLHLDRCSGGFEYALAVCGHFTRFVQIYPTKNKSAKSAAEKLYNEYILNFSFPRRIHHDRGGREFNNELFNRLNTLCGISTSKTTPYHPMGDGQVERMNRNIINMLKTLNENQKSNWKKHV